MPLIVHEGEGEPRVSGRTLIVFYSSRDEAGKMWCPDCRDVEDHVQKIFDKSSETGWIIYVGQKAEWKSSSNKYRVSHSIESIPTIVRLNNGKEDARLVGDEISLPGTLEKFIRDREE